ncbi:glycosyltransferase family 4 protein [Nocardia terpenica]|uniref:Glycosyltransferase subfamily 4-like N-terminal domain-containing protein n=1 Tax=Nocardia terpenica TaxID=455432 RepID=A0A161XIY7_9NOCA|nr:glycosyltransferase family 4 protein [Nocardia terpenica]KZM73718.1 hypothetical protein AWN90_34660 [Nocardia terpenica]MBF6064434.1 glycosyltransferase family 4 protein [Nocardia terpenica]MBF6106942.1 glycosyltransferase family 4 protein [Nocardia terpenica]MBF6114402.1 glycosyltransferase family 4 protein [Nocardia terpenica]MBF6121512.1 glycosyltransferase family 4 protein [Nocardia terpenica]
MLDNPAARGYAAPLRILLVNGNFADGTVGGTQRFSWNLARWLIERGHVVGVLCQGERDEAETVHGIRVYRVRPPALGTPRGDRLGVANATLAVHNPGVAPKVSAALREFRPDVCHIQMLRRLTFATLAAIRRHRVPIVQTVHELFSLWNFNPYRGIHPDWDTMSSRPPWTVRRLKQIHRRLSAGVAHVCAPSELAMRAYRDDGYFRDVPGTVVPNAVPWEWGTPRAAVRRRIAALGHGAEPTRFLYLGRVDYYKGVECLLDALAAVPDNDIRLHVAGTGMLEPRVRAAAAKDGRIVVHGAVDGEHRRALLAEADALVCPSTSPETFGLVVLEAFCAGLPVIASRVGALPELVRHDENGLLVAPGSPDELASALRALREPSRRAGLLTRVADKAEEFSPDRFIDTQIGIYRTVVSASGGH